MWDTELAAFIFFVSMIAITFVFELGFCLPQAFPSASLFALCLHWAVAAFLLHNVAGSLWQLIRIDSSIRGVVLSGKSALARNPSRYCGVCECVAPPRSYHCSQCRICVLKRTHHCLFARRCVGYKNFRYFITLLLYVSISCLYCSFLNQRVVWSLIGGFSIRNFFAHTFPFMFWVLGALSFVNMIVCVLSVLHLCGFAFTFGLFLYHFSLMMRNQTVFERSRSIFIYDLENTLDNVKESLGDRWLWIWLSPWISSKLPRDGLHFPTPAEHRLQSRKTK